MKRSIEICSCPECTANAIALTHEALENWRPGNEEARAEAQAVIAKMSEDGIAELVRACLRTMHEITEQFISERNQAEMH